MTAGAAERLELRAARSHVVSALGQPHTTTMNTLQLHVKYVYKLEGRDFVTASPLDTNEFRINVSKTISVSTMFERDRTRNRNLLNTHCEYVAFIAAPPRHVRHTLRIVDAAPRCKI